MGVKIRPLECGWLTVDFGSIVSGQSGRIRVPVPAFAIEHPKGLVLFDLGMHQSLTRSTDRLGRLVGMLEVEMAPECQLTTQLAAAGHRPSDVALAVPSHLHFDHVGGLAELPDATVIVQSDEWLAAADPSVVAGAYVRDDFDLGHVRKEIEGTFDLFGDGTLVLHRTPGHTAGHQSLLIEGRTLLVGDACNCRVGLDTDALPTFSHDAERHRETFRWLRQQEAGGVRLVFSHDPDQAAQIRAGNAPWDR